MSEIKRVLAEVVRIEEKLPIEGADLIELIKIRGWQVVSQKDVHQVGGLAVYFSIDAVLPEYPEFEFLRKNCYVSAEKSVEGAGFRIKTIKLRKTLSQGLIIPLSELSHYFPFDVFDGDDVTDLLNVKKFDKPIPAALRGRARGNFPIYVPKTDEHRIQNFITRFPDYANHAWEVSLKLDGSSMTVYYNHALPAQEPPKKSWFQTLIQRFKDYINPPPPKVYEGRFGVCSRNLDLSESDENTFWQVAKRLELKDKLIAYHTETGRSIALQGELMGPGIQGNRENLKEADFYLFNIWDIDKRRYFTSVEKLALASLFAIKVAPVYDEAFTTNGETPSADFFLDLADKGFGGKSINHAVREGIVFKSIIDPGISFKAINNNFLLKEKD